MRVSRTAATLVISGACLVRVLAQAPQQANAPTAHVATIAIESEGQAFSWANNGARVIYTIDRRKHLVRTIEVPPIGVKDASARRFR